MNNNSEIISLPFGETIRRTFLYFFVNFKSAAKISSIWMVIWVYELLVGNPSICNFKATGCQESGFRLISLLLMLMSSVCICISYCRNVILREEYKWFSFRFGNRELHFIGYWIVIAIMTAIPIALIIMFYGVVSRLGFVYPAVWMLTALLLIFGVLIFVSRFYLALPAVAVDNRNINLEKAFKITRGNANKIFWGGVLVNLLTVIIVLLLSAAYNFITANFVVLPVFVVNAVFVALLLALNFLSSCLKASFYAHFYQYFVYFHNKKIEDAEAREVQ